MRLWEGRREIRVFCPLHKIDFVAVARSKILCEHGFHSMAEDFPHDGLWEYCCDCQRFSPSEIVARNKASERCVVCNRQVARRYMCHTCYLFIFDSQDAAKRRAFDLSPEGLLAQVCPGCMSATDQPITNHLCDTLGVEFATAATVCIFCNEQIRRPASEQVLQLSIISKYEKPVAQPVRQRVPALSPPKSRAESMGVGGNRTERLFAFEQTNSYAIKGAMIGLGALLMLMPVISLLLRPSAPQKVLPEPQANSAPLLEDGNRAAQNKPQQETSTRSNPNEKEQPAGAGSSTLVISAVTGGVSVSIDDASPRRLVNEKGQIVRLPPGAHKVVASKHGYKRWERFVYLSDNNSQRISIEMQKEESTPTEKALEHLRRAEELTQRRQYDSALAEINEGLKIDPNNQLLLKKRNDLERVKQILNRPNNITSEKQGNCS